MKPLDRLDLDARNHHARGQSNRLSDVGIGFAAFLAPPGPEVIRFTVGQPDFDTPISVVNAAKDALDRGETAYTRTQGSVELCEAVAQHLTVHTIEADPADVVVTPGCKQAVLYGLMAILDAGDEVLLLSPAWPSYDGMVKLHRRCPDSRACETRKLPPQLRKPRGCSHLENKSHHAQFTKQPDGGRLHA